MGLEFKREVLAGNKFRGHKEGGYGGRTVRKTKEEQS